MTDYGWMKIPGGEVRKTSVVCHFAHVLKLRTFAKTGSGQTLAKLQTKKEGGDFLQGFTFPETPYETVMENALAKIAASIEHYKSTLARNEFVFLHADDLFMMIIVMKQNARFYRDRLRTSTEIVIYLDANNVRFVFWLQVRSTSPTYRRSLLRGTPVRGRCLRCADKTINCLRLSR
jgi:hypothetical protein